MEESKSISSRPSSRAMQEEQRMREQTHSAIDEIEDSPLAISCGSDDVSPACARLLPQTSHSSPSCPLTQAQIRHCHSANGLHKGLHGRFATTFNNFFPSSICACSGQQDSREDSLGGFQCETTQTKLFAHICAGVGRKLPTMASTDCSSSICCCLVRPARRELRRELRAEPGPSWLDCCESLLGVMPERASGLKQSAKAFVRLRGGGFGGRALAQRWQLY